MFWYYLPYICFIYKNIWQTFFISKEQKKNCSTNRFYFKVCTLRLYLVMILLWMVKNGGKIDTRHTISSEWKSSLSYCKRKQFYLKLFISTSRILFKISLKILWIKKLFLSSSEDLFWTNLRRSRYKSQSYIFISFLENVWGFCWSS